MLIKVLISYSAANKADEDRARLMPKILGKCCMGKPQSGNNAVF
jgi:hypothetical protein